MFYYNVLINGSTMDKALIFFSHSDGCFNLYLTSMSGLPTHKDIGISLDKIVLHDPYNVGQITWLPVAIYRENTYK